MRVLSTYFCLLSGPSSFRTSGHFKKYINVMPLHFCYKNIWQWITGCMNTAMKPARKQLAPYSLLCNANNDGEEIGATITVPAYRKVADVKTCHSPTTFGGYGTTFTFYTNNETNNEEIIGRLTQTRRPPIGGARRSAGPLILKISADIICVCTIGIFCTVQGQCTVLQKGWWHAFVVSC